VHRQPHDFRSFLVGCVKRAHPAHIAGRKALDIRASHLQVLGRCNSRTFLCFAADQPANLAVQIHL